jgi:hypothetical protein
MVIGLLNPKSTNDSNGKKIHVTVVNDSTGTTVKLRFTICEKAYQSDVISLPANARQEVTINHDQAGWCLVEIREDTSGERAEYKIFDLDLPEYS